MVNSFPNIAVLIPSFNPDRNLINLVTKLSIDSWSRIVIVNDGSTNESNQIFIELNCIKNVLVISHSSNQGKGAALKTGIKYINDNAKTIKGIITVDADGQHLIDDVQKIAKSAQERENDGIRTAILGNELTILF